MSIVGEYAGTTGSEGRYVFQLIEADGASGKFKGVLQNRTSSTDVEGNHHYYHDQGYTAIWFESSDYNWAFRSDYIDNKPNFESWDVQRTSKKSGEVVSMTFRLVIPGDDGLRRFDNLPLSIL